MSDSPKRQMEKLLAKKFISDDLRAGAQHIISNAHWHPVLRSVRYSYFRDICAGIAGSILASDMDDSALSAALEHMVENKFFMTAMNKIKSSEAFIATFLTAVNSLLREGIPATPENIQAIMLFLIEPEKRIFRNMLVEMGDGAKRVTSSKDPFIDADIVNILLNDPASYRRFAAMVDAGITSTAQALAVYEDEIPAPLMVGAL